MEAFLENYFPAIFYCLFSYNDSFSCAADSLCAYDYEESSCFASDEVTDFANLNAIAVSHSILQGFQYNSTVFCRPYSTESKQKLTVMCSLLQSLVLRSLMSLTAKVANALELLFIANTHSM